MRLESHVAWIQTWFPHLFDCVTLDKNFLACFLICTMETIVVHISQDCPVCVQHGE